ncbi:MAG TPA: FAD:protein FMN transferase [Spirochaetota bacterium]|nr:FAD:protein FMN transferase [Spirochaetota bacterium]
MRSIPRFVRCALPFALLLGAIGCRKGELITFNRPMLGTIITITIIADSSEAGVRASEAAFNEIARIEALMSPRLAGSDVARLNRDGGRIHVTVSDETFALIEKSIEVSHRTDGAFDISFASLGHLWNLASDDFRPPGHRETARLLPLVDYRKITLHPESRRVSFALPGMRVGLGGIAKGYAIARAVGALRREGVRASIVDAGGDLQVTGDKFGEPWRVGLMHPRKKEILLTIAARDGDSVVTSGDYERFAFFNGERYHHIIDPKTGFPARGLASVTVLCSDPVLADAYATALFVMGGVRAREFALAHPEIKVILIDEDMRISASRELEDRVGPSGRAKIEWF